MKTDLKVGLIVSALLLAVFLSFLLMIGSKRSQDRQSFQNGESQNSKLEAIGRQERGLPLIGEKPSLALLAGRRLSGGKCSGQGPSVLTHAPMKPEDFSIIVPYGLVIGGHVTPIDHQYFAPKDQNSARDSYEVFAMAESRLVEIQPRTNERGTEYRLVFSVSCTFLYYYDLLTSLEPDIKAVYDQNQNGRRAEVDIPVKAGQPIGRIGGQTLDFAVWDTQKPLNGFTSPELYQAEFWKLYTADPLDYYSPELKEFILSRYARVVEPLSGKIDYDLDGRLIGNWFEEASGGYGGPGGGVEGYWSGHFSIAPDLYDPSSFIISLGDFGGQAKQFAALTESPKPEEVSKASGLVKYDLVDWQYLKLSGQFWDRKTLAGKVKLSPARQVKGCLMVEMTDQRKLKLEALVDQKCDRATGFSARAKMYER